MQHTPLRMAAAAWLALLSLIALSHSAMAVKITVSPGQMECVADTITLEHFEVAGGPRIDGRIMITGYSQYYVPFITIKVTAPTGEMIWQQEHVYSETHFNVAAKGPGSYTVCFFNPWESRTYAVIDLVYFTVAHLRSTPGSVKIPKGTQGSRDTEMAHQDHMEDVRHVILGMSEFMQVISGSQRYLHRKLESHQKTMVSSKSRTAWYAMLETGLLLVVTVTQAFLQFYYQLFEGNRTSLAPLYQEASMLTFEGQQFRGTASIVGKFTALPFQACKVNVISKDCQPSVSGGIMVFVTGHIQMEGESHPLKFSQVFHLMPFNNSFIVTNDMFRLNYA